MPVPHDPLSQLHKESSAMLCASVKMHTESSAMLCTPQPSQSTHIQTILPYLYPMPPEVNLHMQRIRSKHERDDIDQAASVLCPQATCCVYETWHVATKTSNTPV